MSTFIQDSILPVLRKYWWVWLLLSIITLIGLLIGPNVIGGFLHKALKGLFALFMIISFFFWFFKYVIGRGSMSIWGLFRFIGLFGLLFLALMVVQMFKEEDYASIIQDEIKRFTLLIFTGISVGLFFLLGLGELLLYLHKLNYKMKQQLELTKEQKRQNEMICARCLGKGYVDKLDLERLEISQQSKPGACGYCNATGHVPRGSTEWDDPTEVIEDDSSDLIFDDKESTIETVK